jgi:hypothetical protein
MLQTQGALSCDASWQQLLQTASYVINFDQNNGNNKPLVNRH